MWDKGSICAQGAGGLLLLVCASACSAGGGGDKSGEGGSGGMFSSSSGPGVGSVGAGTGGGGIDCSGKLPVVMRDFTTSHPDFEQGNNVDDKGIVQQTLGADGKPVYAGNPTTPTTHGKDAFDQWYRDVDGVNVNIPITIQLTEGANHVFTYDNQSFFPIDGQGLGDEGNTHNYHFTDEVHTLFTYEGGESFTFTGDDDLFGFINGKLVIDLGGIHEAESQTVDLDAMAGALGMKIGEKYPLDLFGAERHVIASHYRVDTTINCFEIPPPK